MNVRPLQIEDVAAGLTLCRIAGWNHLYDDWTTYLTCGGMFVAEEGGAVVATAGAIPYGTDLAWIGVVLTHPDFRGRGLATALMTECIRWLRARGVGSIKLDASDMGKPIYQRLGFVEEQPIMRYRGIAAGKAAPARGIAAAHWPAVQELDRRAFGADRSALLHTIDSQEGTVSAIVEGNGVLTGYGMARPGHLASYIGPVVAADAAAAREVYARLLDALPHGPVFCDALPRHAAAGQLVESLGFTPARTLTRMYLDSNVAGAADLVYAVAGMEYG